MRRRRRWCGLLLLLVLATGCNDSAVGPGVQLGGPAPHIEGTDLDGRPLRLSDLHGQVVLVNFWATWCSPCLEEIPDLVQVAHQFAAPGHLIEHANELVADGRVHAAIVIDPPRPQPEAQAVATREGYRKPAPRKAGA